MTFCPACGNPVSDTTARFCMKCGRELPASAPPPAPAAPPTPTQVSPAPLAAPPPPPPTYAAPTATYPGAGPAGYPPPPGEPGPPSPAAQFVRRVFTGRWDAALVTALVPAVVVLVAAGGLGAWSQHVFKGPLSWMTRSRIALTLAMQGLGGHVSTKVPNSDCADFGDSGSDDGDSGSDYGDSGSDFGDSGSDFGDSGSDFGDSGSDFGDSDGYSGLSAGCSSSGGGISILLLAFTLVWLLALVLALRSMRRRQAGAEAAVRVALLSGLAGMVLAFVAQPKIEGVRLHTAPFLVLLWTFLISLVAGLVVLHGPALSARLGAAYRVVGAAFLGLLVTVLFAGVVVFLIAVGYEDDVTGNGLVAIALLAPNLGVSGLALGWGAPLQVGATGSGSYRGNTIDFGLTRLNDYWGGAATPLAVLAAALCALTLGFIAVRRTRNPVEQIAVAAAFTAMFTVLVSIADLTEGRAIPGGIAGYGGGGEEQHIGSSVSKSLLFALLWSVGGVVAASFLRRVFGPPQAPAVAYGTSPYATPPGHSYLAPQVHNPYIPQQGGPQAAPQPAPQPRSGPAPQSPQSSPHVPPPDPGAHDLGIVQPDRLSKPNNPNNPNNPDDPQGGGRHL